MEVSEAIRSRRSIRKFQDRRIPQDVLEELVDYARLAPSGMNKQPLEFIIVDKPELERKIFDYTSWAGAVDWNPGPKERPRSYILILVNEDVKPVTADYDAGLAAGNICLGAVDRGLGSCILGALEYEAIETLLGIPGNHRLDLAVGLGYPDQEVVLEDGTPEIDYWLDKEGVFHVPKRPSENIIHVNGWDG
ncbi:MAG: nitroreductase family protein [Candidatus Bipolaricaulota bacterium]